MSSETFEIVAQGSASHNSSLPTLIGVQRWIGRTREIGHFGTSSWHRSYGQPIATNALQVNSILNYRISLYYVINVCFYSRYPTLSRKISQLMSDYIQALRSKDDTPGSLLAMTRDAEASILDKYKEEMSTQQNGGVYWKPSQTYYAINGRSSRVLWTFSF